MFYLYFMDASRVLHAFKNEQLQHVAYVDRTDAVQRAQVESELYGCHRRIYQANDCVSATAFTVDTNPDLDMTRDGVKVNSEGYSEMNARVINIVSV